MSVTGAHFKCLTNLYFKPEMNLKISPALIKPSFTVRFPV